MKMLQRMITHLAVLIVYLVGSFGSVHAATSDEIVFFLPDPLGSAIAAVNEDGELCWTETYTPYGDKTVNNDAIAGLGMPDGCGKLGEERGYTGHTEDFESDLVYAQQRYYDPSIGRFMSVDPAAINPYDVRTINRYSYAANNPYKYVDPNGESATEAVFQYLVEVGKELKQHAGYGDGADWRRVGDAFMRGYRADSTVWERVGAIGEDYLAVFTLGSSTLATSTSRGAVTVSTTGKSKLGDLAIAGSQRGAIGVRKTAEPFFKTNAAAGIRAKELGFKKINETVNNQSVYKKGKLFITRDITGHIGGAFKAASSIKNLQSKRTRLGTFDENLRRIGD